MKGMALAEPYRRLTVSIILLAKRDADNGTPGSDQEQVSNRRDALEFFESPWFDSLCEMVDLDPGVIRKAVDKAGNRPAAIC